MAIYKENPTPKEVAEMINNNELKIYVNYSKTGKRYFYFENIDLCEVTNYYHWEIIKEIYENIKKEEFKTDDDDEGMNADEEFEEYLIRITPKRLIFRKAIWADLAKRISNNKIEISEMISETGVKYYYYHGIDWRKVTNNYDFDIINEIDFNIEESNEDLHESISKGELTKRQKFEKTIWREIYLYDTKPNLVAERICNGENVYSFDWHAITESYNLYKIRCFINRFETKNLQLRALDAIYTHYLVDKYLMPENKEDLSLFFESLKTYIKKFFNSKDESNDFLKVEESDNSNKETNEIKNINKVAKDETFFVSKNDDELKIIFNRLRNQKYISEESTLENWLYICGKITKKKDFNKINWVGRKIELVYFIMKFFKPECRKNWWIVSSNMFLFNGKNVSSKNLCGNISQLNEKYNNGEMEDEKLLLIDKLLKI